ncbi:immunity 52 family protein [Pyxidicoccus parkwayensis]|uniref:Immunity 52 family protein n=1 Tax=Pyxidicoccus parkwayensis TaxID=2813578 RepID=A0ABX7NXU6_9BACT|nr:immunity 52 family protein [Pyxidicoccus parkwaysis]QSQ23730.1 immunity 52 family protein [Pyxidicoccus parkwaysis]
MRTSSLETETYFAGAYWGARKESPGECARRIERLLASIAQIDPAFAHWFQLGKSRKDALKRPIEPKLMELEALVQKGKDRKFEDLGFSLGGWNGAGDDYDAAGFSIHCGSYTDVVANSCVIDLPSRGLNSDRVLTSSVLASLVKCMATAWEPDSAVAMSSPHLQLIDKGIPFAVLPGWVTYLARHRGAVPPLPAPVSIEPVEDKGTLIILTPERFTVANPEHVALAERVREQLDRAGLLKPLQLQQ